jgi:hypothetical protein
MLALLCFAVAVLASPFKSKSRLEAEDAVLELCWNLGDAADQAAL